MAFDRTRFTGFTERGQETFRTAVDTWTGALTAMADQMASFPTQGDIEAAVDRWFDLQEQLLGVQRDLAKTLVGYVASAGAFLAERAGAATEAAARSTRAAAA